MFVSIVTAAPVGVIARGDEAGRFWLVVSETDKDKTVTTSVRYLADPVGGRWAEATRLSGQAIDAAPVASRIAVLFDGGAWRMAWDGGSLDGPAPPEEIVLHRIAASGDVLWAIGLKTDGPSSLLRWTEVDGWSVAASLPTTFRIEPERGWGDTSLAIYNGVPWFGYVANGTFTLASLSQADRTWHLALEIPVNRDTAFSDAFINVHLVPGASRPMLRSIGGDYSHLAFWTIDGLNVPEDRRRSFASIANVDAFSDAVVIGPSIRVVRRQDASLSQIAVDDFGRGKTFGPDPIPDPAPPIERQQGEWLNLLVLTGLTVFMLRTLRGEPDVLAPTLPAGLRPAPRGRRVLAGLIDALPLLIIGGFVFAPFDGTAKSLQPASTHLMLPLFLAVLLYFGHLMAGELIFRRSLGKWLLGLRVIASDGTPATTEQIVLRNLLRLVELAFGLPLALPLWMPGGQRLGDLAAKTIVVANDVVKIVDEPTQPN